MKKSYNQNQIQQFASIWQGMGSGLQTYDNNRNGQFIFAEDLIDELARVQRKFTLEDWDRFIGVIKS